MGMKVKYCDYYGDFDFWIENKENGRFSRFKRRIVWRTVYYIRRLYHYKILEGRNNQFFSPWVVLVAQKNNCL